MSNHLKQFHNKKLNQLAYLHEVMENRMFCGSWQDMKVFLDNYHRDFIELVRQKIGKLESYKGIDSMAEYDRTKGRNELRQKLLKILE